MSPALVAYLWASLLAATAWGGTVYTHWGRKTCTNIATTVYSGYIGGSSYYKPGAGANYLCMTSQPSVIVTPRPTYVSTVYGAKYKDSPLPEHDKGALCAFCFVSGTATVMVPGTNRCPLFWQTQYTGILMSGYDGHVGSSEFICVDFKKEASNGSISDGRLLYYDTAVCGILPCPPYQNSQILPCAVCSR